MPFGIDDLKERLGGERLSETFTEEIATSDSFQMGKLSIQDIMKWFPKANLSDSEHIAYIPARMCNSLPTRNKRGRAFFPQVMDRSYLRARDNLVDLDHLLKKHGESEDKVIGHIKDVVFDPEKIWQRPETIQLANNTQLIIPAKPIPMYALMAMYRRTEIGDNIVKQCIEGKRKWKTSMECLADYPESGFLYDGRFIPFPDAPSEMQECVEKMRVKPYKGKELTLCLGGMEGTVDYCGIAMTVSPADGDCDAKGVITRPVMQTASTKRFMPLYEVELPAEVFPEEKAGDEVMELATACMENMLEEKAAIEVIGQTNPGGEDNHVHDVLSDGTILPVQGHTHGISSAQFVIGTNPRYTAKCSESNDWVIDGKQVMPGFPTTARERMVVHTHLINIPLRGKRKGSVSAEAASAEEEFSSLSVEEYMGIKEQLKAIEAKLAALGPTPTAQAVSEIQNELARLRGSQELASAVDEQLQEKLKDYVPKTQYDKDVEEAKKKAKEEAEAEAKKREEATKKQADRIEKIRSLGIDPEHVEQGQTKSLKDIALEIEFDERGEREWGREVARLQQKVDLAKAEKDKSQKEADQKEAAAQQASVPRPFLLGGSGDNNSNAQTGGGNRHTGTGPKLPDHFRGKSGLMKR